MKVARKLPCLCNFIRIVLTCLLFAHIGAATEFIDTGSPVTENFSDNRTYRPILHSKDVKNRYEGSVTTNVDRISDISKQNEEKDTRGCPGCVNTSGGCNTNQVSNSIPVGMIIAAVIVGIVWIIVGLAIYFAFLESFGGGDEQGYGYGYNRRNEKLPPVPDFNQIDYSIKNSNLNRFQYKH